MNTAERGLHPKTGKPVNPWQQAWLDVSMAFENLGAVPLIAGLLGAVGYLMLVTPQGPDLTHTVVQDGVQSFHFELQVTMLCLASLWLGGQAWFWSRRMVDDACGKDREAWRPQWLLEWFPRALGAAPFVIAAVGFLRNQEGEAVIVWVLCLLGVAFGVLLWARTLLLGWAQKRTSMTNEGLDRFGDRVAKGSVVVALLTLAVFSVWPVGPSQLLGAIGVVYVGVGMIIPPMAAAIHWGRRWQFPVLGALVLWAVLLTALGQWTTDNHAVGRRAFGGGDIASASLPPRVALKDAFDTWYDHAPLNKDGKKTLIVVAAAGGASRAGYWAAQVLGDLQDQTDGNFSKSVFALSSVSGGSVGAAAFVSQLHDEPRPAIGFGKAVRLAAGGDYLSPALGGVLFPDLAQRFIPTIPKGGGGVVALPDRAEALEKAFEAGWAKHCDDAACNDRKLWSEGYRALWLDPARAPPLMFVNGARQEDGRRILTAPVWIDPLLFPDAVDFFALTGGRDIAVSTAIHNGARFPLVSPGGTLLDLQGRAQGHVLDGGYFENSGVTTAGDLIHAVQAFALADPTRRNIRPILIELNNDSDAKVTEPAFYRNGPVPPLPTPAQLLPVKTGYFLADLAGPLAGLSSGRDGRATPVAITVAKPLGQDYVLLHLCNIPPKGKKPRRREPMDWVLSQQAKEAMAIADDVTLKTDACGNRTGLANILAAVQPSAAAPAEAP